MTKTCLVMALAVTAMLCLASCRQPQRPVAEPAPNSEPQGTAAVAPVAPADPADIPDGVWVRTAGRLEPISPLVFGTNYGPWMAVPVDNVENFEQSGLNFLRFPGGRWGDSNDLRDYQIRQLMTHVDQIDGDVTISARLLGGSPEQAAALVQLVNDEMGHDVEYWSIGNEPSLYQTFQDAEQWDTAHYNEQWRLFAEAMLAVDPDIRLLGPNTHQFRADETQNPKDDEGLDWMREFLRANGEMIDVVTFHRYPFPTNLENPVAPAEELRDNSEEWDEIIPKIREVIREETGRDLPIGIMEINSSWSDGSGSESTPDSHLSAIWWADVLARMIHHDVEMVTHFALNSNRSGWALLTRNDVRPAYFVYRMFDQLGETQLETYSDHRYVTVVAAERDADEVLTVLLVNRSTQEIAIPLQVDDGRPVVATEAWRFDADNNAVDLGASDIDGDVTLPGESITVYVINR